MKKLISALLCLLVLSSCKIGGNKDIVYDVNTSEDTVELRSTEEPEVVISFDDLDDFSFVIEVEGKRTIVNGNNINGSKSYLYVESSDASVIYELNTKGNNKLFHKASGETIYTEYSIEYGDADFDALYELLSYVGVDFGRYYGKSEFILQSESSDQYVYALKCDEGDFTVHIDKKTGIWTKVFKGDEEMIRVREHSLTKGVIPNH